MRAPKRGSGFDPKETSLHRSKPSLGGRGRDASYLAPPAQSRTCGFPAYGLYGAFFVKGASRHFCRALLLHSFVFCSTRAASILPSRPHIAVAVARSGGQGRRLYGAFFVKGASRHFCRALLLHSFVFCSTRAASILPSRPHIAVAVARSGGQGRRLYGAFFVKGASRHFCRALLLHSFVFCSTRAQHFHPTHIAVAVARSGDNDACMELLCLSVHHATLSRVVTPFFCLLFDPRREHSSIPTAHCRRRRAQRRSRRRLYGAFSVKVHHAIFVARCYSILLSFVRPRREHSSIRPHIAVAVARSGGQGRRFFSAAEGLSLTDASTAAGCP